MRAFHIAIAALAATLVVAPLVAHPRLVTTTPAAKATVSGPKMVELKFSEKLVAQFSGADVTMTEMPGMAMSKPMKMSAKASVGKDGKTLVMTFDKPLPQGSYNVAWHAVATDTHRINGSFAFKVK